MLEVLWPAVPVSGGNRVLSAAPLQGSGDSSSVRAGLPLCWESGFPNSDGGGKADDGVCLAGLWAVVRGEGDASGAGVTCCRNEERDSGLWDREGQW